MHAYSYVLGVEGFFKPFIKICVKFVSIKILKEKDKSRGSRKNLLFLIKQSK